MQSTDFPSIVSPLMAGSRRRLATGGAAWTQNGSTTPGAAWTDPSLWVPQAPAVPDLTPYTAPNVSSGAQGGNGGRSGVTPATPSALGGYMPTVSTVASDMGVSPAYGKMAQALVSALAPPLGMAMTGYGLAAQASNTTNNASMLGRMGVPLNIGQIAGGVLGLNGYGGTPEGAMNSAMNTPAGRQALSTSQIGGVIPGVSMPTQTVAPVSPVSSESLGDPMGDNTHGGGNGGMSSSGPSGMAGTGGHGAEHGTGGEGTLARGGLVRSPARGSARGKPGTNIIIVMPHPVMGALALAAMHDRMNAQSAPAGGALQAARR